ncbi:MAG: shikimate kinase [Terriglobales bacterium]
MSTEPGGQPETLPSAPGSKIPGMARSIFLVGFMGAGKSSVGQVLSHKLGWPFEDLDERIQARENRSIEQIFSQSGEARFRQVEHAALRSLVGDLQASPRVVALGGGAFAQPGNAALIEAGGFPAVFLDASAEELFERCRRQQLERPLRGDLEEFRRLYESRRPCYLKAALRIETGGKNVEAVATEVIQNLGMRESQPEGKER